jgi:hypothetical protein
MGGVDSGFLNLRVIWSRPEKNQPEKTSHLFCVRTVPTVTGWGFLHWGFLHWGFLHWGFLHWGFLHWGFLHQASSGKVFLYLLIM